MENLRTYGKPPYKIAVVHGGPGIPGDLQPLAEELAKEYGILEPLQTENTLQGQVNELAETLKKNANLPIILIGHSWGAMLSFLTTIQHPSLVSKLILVGSGEFEQEEAEGIMATRNSRLTSNEQKELNTLLDDLAHASTERKKELFALLGKYSNKTDSYDPMPHPNNVIEPQPEIFESVWGDAERLRKADKFLEGATGVTCPVIAIHGDYDPHPANGIKTSLSKVLPNFKFILLEKCGHYPWLEKQARDHFFETLKDEIAS